MAEVGFEVTNLRAFKRDLKRAGDQYPKLLQQTNKRVVQEIVVPEAKRRGNASRRNAAGGTARLGSEGVATIRALASATKAEVALGSARIRWAQGSEWGSQRYKQFPKPSRDGYILTPAVEEKRPEIIEEYAKSLDGLSKIITAG